MDFSDVNHWRIAVTVLSFLVFLAIVVWAWSARNAASFDEAARLPLVPEPSVGASATKEMGNE